MSELSARSLARVAESARDGGRDEAEEKSQELVSRREPARVVLGTGARVSSHRTHLDELRAARGAAFGVGGGIGKTFSAPPRESRVVEEGIEGTRREHRVTGRTSALATERGDSAGGSG